MKNGDCDFFRWEEEVGRINISWEELQGKLFEKDKVIAELEAEKIMLDKKNEQIKNQERQSGGGYARHDQ